MMYLKLNCSINHEHFGEHGNPRITEEHHVNLHDVLFIIKGLTVHWFDFFFYITKTGPVYLKSLQQSVMPRIPEEFRMGSIASNLVGYFHCTIA